MSACLELSASAIEQVVPASEPEQSQPLAVSPDQSEKPATAQASPNEQKVALLVIAHTPSASALKSVAEHVFGSNISLTAIDVLPGANASDSTEALLGQLRALNQGKGVLIMTDLPGASPANVCTSAASRARQEGIACEVVSGVNAAMLLRALTYQDDDLEKLATAVISGASKAVTRIE